MGKTPAKPGPVKRKLTRSEIMGRVKSKDSTAELELRHALHRRGLRYRLHRRVEGVNVDVVFAPSKVAVFVDGCFWHGCPKHATSPKSNTAYWLPKLSENKERDLRQTKKLRKAGWKVIRIWEHECKRDPKDSLFNRIERTVRARRSEGSV